MKKPNTGVVVSSVAHVAVLAYAVVGFSHSKFDPAPESIAVEVMTTSEFDRLTKGEKTSKKVADKPKVEAKKIDQVVPEPKPPLPEAKENVEATPPLAETPPEPPKPEPKPEPPKQAEAPPPPPEPKPADLPKPPEKKVDEQSQAKLDDLVKEVEKKPEPKKPEPKKVVEKKTEKPKPVWDPTKIMRDNRAPGRKPQGAPEPADMTNAGIATGPVGQLALSEQSRINAMVSEQLHGCWRVPAGAKDVADMAVLVQFRMAEDGSLVGQPKVMNSSSNPIFQATAESAVRAVYSCSPLKLPVQFYDHWKFVEINFDPKDVL